jgi:hypothetical protein
MPDLFEQESNMSNKLLGAAAMAALILAVQPASAAKMGGCSSENLAKTESMIEATAGGEGKMSAQKEIARAQDAMLNGEIGVCAAHLSKAMHAGMAVSRPFVIASESEAIQCSHILDCFVASAPRNDAFAQGARANWLAKAAMVLA